MRECFSISAAASGSASQGLREQLACRTYYLTQSIHIAGTFASPYEWPRHVRFRGIYNHRKIFGNGFQCQGRISTAALPVEQSTVQLRRQFSRCVSLVMEVTRFSALEVDHLTVTNVTQWSELGESYLHRVESSKHVLRTGFNGKGASYNLDAPTGLNGIEMLTFM